MVLLQKYRLRSGVSHLNNLFLYCYFIVLFIYYRQSVYVFNHVDVVFAVHTGNLRSK